VIYFRTIDIPFDELFALAGQTMLDGIMENIAKAAYTEWKRLAGDEKSHLRQDYMKGMQPIEYSPGKAVLTLAGELPHLLEDGDDALDLRKTLLGPNVPIVPEGQRGAHLSLNDTKYRSIPFRHTGPSTGKVLGQAMGSAYSGHQGVLDSMKLGKAIMKAARKLQDYSIREQSTENSPPRRLRTFRIRAGLAPGMKQIPLLKPHHKTNIYEGMIREAHTYEKATQNKFTTFRTISTGVTEGWIRGPIAARHYLDRVSDYVAKIAPMTIEKALEVAP
jgi:hypothetical protein